jgi:hypothetical protein
MIKEGVLFASKKTATFFKVAVFFVLLISQR